MGFYINPIGKSKEQWLKENGELSPSIPKEHIDSKGNIVVCLVDNGWMTAAGIAIDKHELDAFAWPADKRPKQWYLVPIKNVLECHPEYERAIEKGASENSE